ncbi:tRNA pseudouridine(13) synthase TruD [Thioalkalivibrio sp. HK1]|uniref:tRNA pseudouridine(13) synthase TruD n=1 Tax=Thioalkalivibrio sp. HK1 TaxID=1469245 RepID=UPI0018CC3B4D|nr:tRNA pseudouridine(13) synthase TruD [Thioalkalivibrio sp. HK1]
MQSLMPSTDPSFSFGRSIAGEPPPARARLSDDAQDFRVVEIPKFTAQGSGSHAWLKIEKRRLDTIEVADALARLAGVPPSAVGFAGMKDRVSVATQWFSVDLANRPHPAWERLQSDALSVLEATSHSRKLRRGALLGNRFEIVLRKVLIENEDRFQRRLEGLRQRGMANYFGAQRFGIDGSNLRLAEDLLIRRRRIKDRFRRSLALSAARSFVFNRVLAARTEGADDLLPGDVMMLEGRKSVFSAPEIDESMIERFSAGEIHPTGPLWGRGRRLVQGKALKVEDRIVADSWALCRGLERERVDQARRALRVFARNLEVRLEGDRAHLSFDLPPGSYATVLIGSLFALEAFRGRKVQGPGHL